MLFSAITNGAMLPSTSLTLEEVHLVHCLTKISQSYFAPGRSVVISSPASYRDVQQELVAEIHRNSIWPVVVTVDGNIREPHKTDFIDRDGSYIILIPDGNIESLYVEILGLISDRENKFTKLWNYETRFVVAGANVFSMSQQTDIFDYFSKFRIYNIIIVSKGRDVIHKEYSRTTKVNEVDTAMKLGVYTWFPYQSSDRCTEVNDITLLDSWVISAQGHFTKNTDLFPRKINNSFNGCPMKALVFDLQWFFTTKYVNRTYSNGTVVTYIEGLEMELLEIVLQKMNMTFINVPSRESLETAKNWLYVLFTSLFLKEYYIIVGNMGNNIILYPHFSSTNSYYIITVCWYVPCSDKYPRWRSIFKVLSVELWLVLIISIVTVAISTTIVARYSCTSEWPEYKSLKNSFTNIWAVILGLSVSKMPRNMSLSSLFLAWVCFSLAFRTVFKAFLTTFLTDSGYKTPIKNLDELFASGIKPAYPLPFNSIFEISDGTESFQIHTHHVNCASEEVCFAWAKYHKNASILLMDKIAEELYASGDLVGENSEPLLCKLEDGMFRSFGQSMVMLHGDPLMRRVNEIIDRVVEAGLHKLWDSQQMNWYKINSRKLAIVHPLDEYYSFNLYHMQPAFYLLLMGWCLSAICLLFEVLYSHLLSKRI